MPQAHLTRSPGNVFTECKNPRTVRELHLSGVRSREWLPQPAQDRQVPVPKMARVLRRYHYLSVVKEDREGTRLVRERVKCGKPSCRYAQDVRHRHGPYLHVRYEEYDRRTWETSFRGSTFPRVSSRGCATESAARGPPAHVGVRSWRSYAATSWGGTVIIPHMAFPRNAPLTAKARDAPLAANGQYEAGKVCGCRRSLPNPLRRSSALR